MGRECRRRRYPAPRPGRPLQQYPRQAVQQAGAEAHMFNSVRRLSPEQSEAESKDKERIMRLNTHEVNSVPCVGVSVGASCCGSGGL